MKELAQTFAPSPHVTVLFQERGRLFGGEGPNDRPLIFSRLVVEAAPTLLHTRKTASTEHRLDGRREAGILGSLGCFTVVALEVIESLGACDLGQPSIRSTELAGNYRHVPGDGLVPRKGSRSKLDWLHTWEVLFAEMVSGLSGQPSRC